MKNKKMRYTAFVLLVTAAISGIVYSQAEKIKLAISSFDSLTETAEKQEAGKKASRIVEEGYHKLSGFEIRKSDAINNYINKLALAQAGVGDLDSLKGIGKDLKIDYLTVGSVSIYGHHCEMDTRTVNINNWLIVHSTGISSFDLHVASEAVCRDANITLSAQDIKEKESLERACVSVFKFTGGNTAADETGIGGVFAELLNSELGALRGLSVIERTYSRSLINEKILEMAGIVENDTSDESFRIRGIDYKLQGTVNVFEGLVGVSYSLSSTINHKKIFSGYTEFASVKDLRHASKYLAKIIESAINEKIGSVEITSEPAGANVEIDGIIYNKKTPLVTSLEKGTHTFKFTLNNFEDEIRADIKSKNINTVRAKLKSAMSSLKVTSKPGNAEIEIDGKGKGKTPLDIAILRGKHKVILSLDGYESETREIELKAGKKTTLDIELKKEERKAVKNIGGIDFVYINGGSFMMGSPDDQGEKNEHPRRKVSLDAFYIGRYEVTQKQYIDIMGKNPSIFKGDNNPVEQVSWDKAMEFCIKFSQKYNVQLRLPTEAEWEYACRAGTNTAYHWGNDFNQNYCWTYESSNAKTHPVGGKKPNAWGLYDMAGNVWEWCMDWFSEDYYVLALVSSERNPQGPSGGVERVLRGGSYYDDYTSTRSAMRYNYSYNSYGNHIGFRVVLSGSTKKPEKKPDESPVKSF